MKKKKQCINKRVSIETEIIKGNQTNSETAIRKKKKKYQSSSGAISAGRRRIGELKDRTFESTEPEREREKG